MVSEVDRLAEAKIIRDHSRLQHVDLRPGSDGSDGRLLELKPCLLGE